MSFQILPKIAKIQIFLKLSSHGLEEYVVSIGRVLYKMSQVLAPASPILLIIIEVKWVSVVWNKWQD